MLKLSRKVEYGLMMLMHMDAQTDDGPASARTLARRHSIPEPLLGKVLQALARAALVESIHGARGGYRLKRRLEEIRLGDVIEAIDGPLRMTPCQEAPSKCVRYPTCTIRQPVCEVRNEIARHVFDRSMASFRTPVRPARAGAPRRRARP
jgi:Rrf2 family protein